MKPTLGRLSSPPTHLPPSTPQPLLPSPSSSIWSCDARNERTTVVPHSFHFWSVSEKNNRSAVRSYIWVIIKDVHWYLLLYVFKFIIFITFATFPTNALFPSFVMTQNSCERFHGKLSLPKITKSIKLE